jgi:phosphomannomutase
MTLIKSISGIRGTIGGKPGDSLSPIDVVKFTTAYAQFVRLRNPSKNKIVIGRDARMSGEMIRGLVCSTLQGCGFDVVDLGLSTTPTVEMAVVWEDAGGGVILTASHNPKEWNALKMLNEKGEFISGADGQWILEAAEKNEFDYANVLQIGKVFLSNDYMQQQIVALLNHPLVDVHQIQSKNFKIVVDAINSTGAIFVPALLKALGVVDIIAINSEVNGDFAHNPEPLPEHLKELSKVVVEEKADLGIAVDPDVDRLCFVNEDGSLFGEEYTLVAVADYVLSNTPGNTVSNMSSTRALRDVTEAHGGQYFPSAVGEVNVVTKMKNVNAVIGGEGNGGIICPELHYGRDALAGIALFMTHLAKSNKTISELRKSYPNYVISKNKIELSESIVVANIFKMIQDKYQQQPINTEDGLKIEFDKNWVHLRTSNTEPIIRIYAESTSESEANNLALQIMKDIQETIKGDD